MHENSTSTEAFIEPPLPEKGSAIGYENTLITKVPGWHGIIAWDALLNGMATGLFLAAAVCELAAPAVFLHLAKVAYPVALVLLLIDLGLLVLDLGDPFRFHHMLRVFKPGSPMSVGTWSLTIFSLPLTAAAGLSLLALLGIDFEWARILAVVVGLLPAFGSMDIEITGSGKDGGSRRMSKSSSDNVSPVITSFTPTSAQMSPE